MVRGARWLHDPEALDQLAGVVEVPLHGEQAVNWVSAQSRRLVAFLPRDGQGGGKVGRAERLDEVAGQALYRFEERGLLDLSHLYQG